MSKLRALLRRRRRFIVFCLVGGSGVFVNQAAFSLVLLVWPGAESLKSAGAGSPAIMTAGFVGWVVSVLSNFVLNDRFTFDDQIDREATTWQRRLGRYYVSATATLVLQLLVLNAVLWQLTEGYFAATLAELMAVGGLVGMAFGLVGIYVRAFSNLCGIAVGTVINYILSKRWVFK